MRRSVGSRLPRGEAAPGCGRRLDGAPSLGAPDYIPIVGRVMTFVTAEIPNMMMITQIAATTQ
jgi:hypothetical protein